MGVNINKSGPEVICSTELPVDINKDLLRNYPLSKIMGVNINKSGPEVICKTQLPVDINKDLC